MVNNKTRGYSFNEHESNGFYGFDMALIYNQESYAINGAAMEVYNQLGHGFLEAVYQEALEKEFQLRGIPFEREKLLTIRYKGENLQQTYKADFVCYGKIIVELKAVSELDDAHRSQVYNYLHATGFRLGIILNFGSYDGLERERIICYQTREDCLTNTDNTDITDN